MFSTIELCLNLKILFFKPIRLLDFFFLIILSELTDQCVIAIYRQGSSALVVHLINVFPLISRKFNSFFLIVYFIENPLWPPCSKKHLGA